MTNERQPKNLLHAGFLSQANCIVTESVSVAAISSVCWCIICFFDVNIMRCNLRMLQDTSLKTLIRTCLRAQTSLWRRHAPYLADKGLKSLIRTSVLDSL